MVGCVVLTPELTQAWQYDERSSFYIEDEIIDLLARQQVRRDMVVLLADGHTFAFIVTGPGRGI